MTKLADEQVGKGPDGCREEGNVTVWVRNASWRVMCLNTWSPTATLFEKVWEPLGGSLAGGSTSLRLWGPLAFPHFQFSLCFLCGFEMWSLSLFWRHSYSHVSGPLQTSSPVVLEIKMNSFFFKLLLVMEFHHKNKNITQAGNLEFHFAWIGG